MKKSIYIIGILILALIAFLAFKRINNNKEIFKFETTTIKTGDISSVITATGSLEAITTVDVGTQVSGIIQDIFVDFNSDVKSGQTIAILDTTMLYSSLQNNAADLQQKKANLDFNEKNFDRVKFLYESNTVAESDFDQAKFNYETAKANYLSSKASFKKAQINLSYATIISPINGVVISRSVDEGQTVAASLNTPTLFSIAQDLTKMQVVASIDEADIGQLKKGNKVLFTVDAYPDDEFEGQVIQIRLEPTISQNVVTYNVLIDAPNPDLKLMPGMTTSLSIEVAEVKNVLKIQSKALRYSPSQEVLIELRKKMMEQMKSDNDTNLPSGTRARTAGGMQGMLSRDLPKGESMVWVKTEDFIKPARIKTGLSNGTSIAVLEGLNEWDEVVSNEIKEKKKDSKNQKSPFMPNGPGRK